MKRTNVRNLKISSQKIHVTTNNVSLINILTSSGISMLLETGWWPETEILADEVRPGLMRHVEIFHGRKNTTAVPPLCLDFISRLATGQGVSIQKPRIRETYREKNLFRFSECSRDETRWWCFLTRCSYVDTTREKNRRMKDWNEMILIFFSRFPCCVQCFSLRL